MVRHYDLKRIHVAPDLRVVIDHLVTQATEAKDAAL